jgi:hypothetical protein
VLLDGHGEVGAPFDGRVVGDDHHFAPGDAADARDDAGGGRVVVVQIPGGQRRQFEKRGVGIEEQADAFAHGQLALLAVALEIARAAALSRAGVALAHFLHEREHARAVGLILRAVGPDLTRQYVHQ